MTEEEKTKYTTLIKLTILTLEACKGILELKDIDAIGEETILMIKQAQIVLSMELRLITCNPQ